jgi:hypothetical protein
MGGWFVDIFVEYIVRVAFRAANLIRSRKWPIVKGTVLSAECPSALYGCTVATVYYEYLVDGEKYGGWYEKPFISHESGAEYANHFVKDMDFTIRVKPTNSTTTVPL